MTPTYEIRVRGARADIELTAIVDTGFDGDLCLPIEVAVPLGLELVGREPIELADGTQKNELLFAAQVECLGETREVTAFLTESDDPLIGTNLLSDCRLTVDFTTERVTLVRKPSRREKKDARK